MGLWEAMRGRTQPKQANLDALFLGAERGDHAADRRRASSPPAPVRSATARPTGRRSPRPRTTSLALLRDDAEAPDVEVTQRRLRLHLAGGRRRHGRRARAVHRPARRQHHARGATVSAPGCCARWCRSPTRRAQRFGLVYLYKQGTFYPFAPSGEQTATTCWSCRCATCWEPSCPWSPTCSGGWRSGGSGVVREAEARDRSIAAYDVLDGAPRRELDSLVQLAAQVAGVPFAAVNLLSSHSQHQVATAGFDGADSPIDHSMCRLVVESGKPIMLEDAGDDVRFAHNPWTTGELADVKYYGSHPLTTPAGVTIGTLCVFDDRSHEVTPQAARGWPSSPTGWWTSSSSSSPRDASARPTPGSAPPTSASPSSPARSATTSRTRSRPSRCRCRRSSSTSRSPTSSTPWPGRAVASTG